MTPTYAYEATLKEIQLPSLVQVVLELWQPGMWLLLDGDLGAGKTTLTQKLLFGLGVPESVQSPTFSIWNSYETAEVAVAHLDLYRLKSGAELCYLGLEQVLRSKTRTLIEWPSQCDTEDWENFFQTTGCRRPQAALTLFIERLQHDDGKHFRRYSLTLPHAFP
jgi:tRNA threonylcarbamoyladenosine biosynthesis protein TsaE